MLKIPESQSRITYEGDARKQPESGRQFGGEKQKIMPALKIPDVAGIQYRGDMAQAQAISSAGENISRVALDMKAVADKEKRVAASATAENTTLELQREVNRTRKEVDNEAEVNGWTSDAREKEYMTRRDALVEIYKAKDIFHPEVKRRYTESLDKYALLNNIDYDKHMSNVRLGEIKEALKGSDQLRYDVVANTNDAGVVADAIERQKAAVQMHGNASVDMTQEMVQGAQSDVVNRFTNAFLANVLNDDDYDTALSSLETLAERYPEIDRTAAKKKLRALQKEKEAHIERVQNKHDANYLGTFDLSLSTGKDIPTVENIMGAGMKDVNTSNALDKLKAYWAKKGEDKLSFDYIEKMRNLDPNHFFGDTSDKTGKMVDAWFENRLETYDELFQQNPMAAYVAMTKDVASVGVVPSAFRGNITKLLNSNDEQQIAFGATMLKTLENEAPQIIAQDFKHFEKEVIVADFIDYGVNAIDSKSMANEFVRMDKTTRDARMKDARSFLDDPTEDIQDAIDASDNLDWEIYGAPKIPDGMKEEYTELYSRFYVAYQGNTDMARNRAQNIVTNTWGRTGIDGSDRMMKKSPEQIYSNGVEAEWISEQFENDLDAFKLAPDDTVIFVDPKSKNSKMPVYNVWDKNQSQFILDETNNRLQWKPDKQVYDAQKIEQKRLEQDTRNKEKVKDDFGIENLKGL